MMRLTMLTRKSLWDQDSVLISLSSFGLKKRKIFNPQERMLNQYLINFQEGIFHGLF